MTALHRALIVEDERFIAEELEDIVGALECEVVVVDNKRDAIAALDREPICVALVDLQVKLEPDHLRGNPEVGASLVREIRKRYPEHVEGQRRYRTPILVVSGHASQTRSSVPLMQDGADDVIEKPFERQDLSKRLRDVLERSGRKSHDACLAMRMASPRDTQQKLVLRLTGERDKMQNRRTIVWIESKQIPLTDTMLRTLLELIAGNLSDKEVYKTDLGGTEQEGFRGVAELKKELTPSLGDVSYIRNHHNGFYSIDRPIEIETIDVEKLRAIGNKRITELAEELSSLRDPKV
jgi:DNA-binding response OmpR family regulator